MAFSRHRSGARETIISVEINLLCAPAHVFQQTIYHLPAQQLGLSQQRATIRAVIKPSWRR
jgi:hypothetical protein